MVTADTMTKTEALSLCSHAQNGQLVSASESKDLGLFAFADPQSGLVNGPMSGLHSCTDALTDKPARELASGITGTEHKGNDAPSPR